MNAKLTQDEFQAIKERAEKYKMDIFATLSNEYQLTKVDIPKLLAEIERLQAEVHEHSAHNGQLIAGHVIPTKEENKRLKAEVDRLREALEFYADKTNWQHGQVIDETGERFPTIADVDADFGKIAREALK